VSVVVFTALATVVTLVVRSALWRVLSWAGAIIAVGAVGFSRVELGVHWVTDVLASVAVVTGWVVVIFALFGIERARPSHAEGGGAGDMAVHVPEDAPE
jgi:undecaprenyl-diphosphatase